MKCKFIVFTALAIAAPSSATMQAEPDSEGGSQVDHDPTPNDILIIEAQEKKIECATREGTELIFATIKEELDLRFAHRFGNGDKRCRVVTDALEDKVYEIWTVAISSYFDATAVTYPQTSSIAQARTFALATLRATVAGIIDGVALIDEYHGDDIRTKIDEIEKETIEDAANVVRNIYVPILNSQDCSTPTRAKLQLAEENSVSCAIQSIKGIFRGTRSVLAKVFPDVDFGVSGCFSLDTIENSTLTGFHEMVKSIFYAEDLLLDAKLEKPTHLWSPVE